MSLPFEYYRFLMLLGVDRIDEVLDEHRPPRYRVDDDGHAPWMDDAAAQLHREALALMQMHDDLGGWQGMPGGDVA